MDRKKIVGQGLNWQAIVIEEAETNIKVAIKNNLTGGKFSQAKKDINKAIDTAVKELESEELKAKTREALKNYAYEQYYKMFQNMGISMAYLLYAFNSLKQGKSIQTIVDTYSPAPPDDDEDEALYDRVIAVPTTPYKDYYKRVKETLNELSKSTVKYDGNISLRNIAEMTVRYEDAIANINQLKAEGVNLVQTTRHANCSKRCEPWQGGYYTLDNTYQVVDGIAFQPLSNATDIFQTTKKGKTYRNGHITGFNCRHKVMPYRKGYQQPMVSAKTIEREREIDQTMRAYERKVRKYKDKALMFQGVDDKAYRQAKALAVKYNQEYINYAKSKKRAFYPSRTEIF